MPSRRPAGRPGKQSRQRNYAREYQRRNEQAQGLGYKNYQDFRAHDYGRIPPNEPPLQGEELQERLGKRGPAAMLRRLGPGDQIFLLQSVQEIVAKIDSRGRYPRFRKNVIDLDGRLHTYVIPKMTRRDLAKLIVQEERKGAVFSPAPSLDQRRLVNVSDLREARA